MSDARLVAMTRAQRNLLAAATSTFTPAVADPLNAVVAAWDAAPADPTEAVRDILLDTQGHARLDDVAAILAALGHPDAE